MSTFCGSSGRDLSAIKSTKFKQNEIRNFYLYFKKFSNNGETINLEQFKRSLGILGCNNKNFICDRLFELIDRENNKRITFEKYLEFLNMVNYGTYDEKCKHTFDFFDLQNKGRIDKFDFRKIIYELCLYFSSISTTQVKIREVDIDIIYDEIMDKIDSHILDFQNFKTATIENPEILDFFDIFNNKILENMTLVIHRQILRRLNGLSNSLDHLIEQISSVQKNKKGFTISLKSFIERSIKKETLINEGVIITKTTENQSSKNNYFLGNQTNNNMNSGVKNNPNNNSNDSFIATSAIYNHSSGKNENKSNPTKNEIIKENKNLNFNRQKQSKNEESFTIDNTENEILMKNKKEDQKFYDDKLISSFEMDNSISNKKEGSVNSNNMFSVSKKLNVPFFPDHDEEDIDISEDEQSEEENSEIATEKSEIFEIIKKNKKENNNSYKNRSNSASNLKDDNTKSNTGINDVSNNEGINYDRKIFNERFSLKENFGNSQTQNILFNNINNIHNINIVNNEITNIEDLNKLSQLNLLNKKSSLKPNSDLPPTHNVLKKSSIRRKDKEESINEFFNKSLINNKENKKQKNRRKTSVDIRNSNLAYSISKQNDYSLNDSIYNRANRNLHKSVDVGIIGLNAPGTVKNYRDSINKNSLFNTGKYFVTKDEDFLVLSPKIIKNKEYLNELKENGLELDKCIIISNKSAFLNYLIKLKTTLEQIIYDIDPKEAIKRKRRKGNQLNLGADIGEIKKEDFLNSTPPFSQEKGMIHFGNKNIELVLSMMIGIRNSINSIGESPTPYPLEHRDQAFRDFNVFHFVQKKFDNHINSCEFYDFAPKVFYNIRQFYGIKNEDYLKSLGPENFLGNLLLTKNRSLREMCSSGKSGSFFYYSYDNKYVLKTISTGEFEFFKGILEDYYLYMRFNSNTLIQRFFGLHTMVFNEIKMHFVIMNNVFNTNIKINYKYDLKGSSYSRLSRDPDDVKYERYDFNIPMKDLDFEERKECFHLESEQVDILLDQIKSDSDFLASKNINDYSLLIGVHDFELNKDNIHDAFRNNLISMKEQKLEAEETTKNAIRKPFFEFNNGGLMTVDKNKILFIGIIDIFTTYGMKKKMEHFFKGIAQGSGISCKPPLEYSERFKNYMKRFLKKSSKY